MVANPRPQTDCFASRICTAIGPCDAALAGLSCQRTVELVASVRDPERPYSVHEPNGDLPKPLIDRIRRIDRVATQARTEHDPARRTANRAALAEMAEPFVEERDKLADRLRRGGDWLRRNADAPDRVERERRWLGWLDEYVAIGDALAKAREAL